MHQILDEAGLGPVTLYPMVRGRLVAINDRPVRPEDYPEDRARRLVDREFNLSYASQLPAHNQQARGRWIDPNAAEVSAETGIMDTLGLSLGDRLRFDVGGQTSEMTLVGARELKWDSMQVNFFMIGSPAVLASQPQNLITAFHVPAGKEGVVRRLSAAMSNLTIIDTGVIGAQIQSMIGQVVSAVQFLFLFTVAAGCVVLYAAMGSLRDERVAEVALMRALGASRRQLGLAQLVEPVGHWPAGRPDGGSGGHRHGLAACPAGVRLCLPAQPLAAGGQYPGQYRVHRAGRRLERLAPARYAAVACTAGQLRAGQGWQCSDSRQVQGRARPS